MSDPDCVKNHHVEIFDRGGTTRRAELVDVSAVSWGRVRDDISEATVAISARNCSRQAEILNGIKPGRHEIVIWRDDERAFEGPVRLRGDGAGGVKLTVKDVLNYTTRLIMRSAYDNSYHAGGPITVVQHAVNVLTTELTRKDVAELAVGLPSINVLPYLTPHATPGEAETALVTVPYQYYVSEHIKSLAADRGIDFTVVGRAIHLWDTSYGLGKTPIATEKDFLGEITVSEYGAELGTYSAATDGRGNYGDTGGVDDYYGLVERLETAYDETSDEAVPSTAELESQAIRNLKGRNPTPIQVRVPDNSGISPTGVLKTKLLIPGVYVPLRATLGIRQITQMQKLRSMKVTENAKGEKITVVLYPASGPDVLDGA